jgi:tetratricopeptide (TPR) repeat protein
VFLKPDGTEVDRLLGYMTAEQLLTEGAGVLTGKTAIDRAKEDLAKGDAGDPVLHLKLANACASKGKADEAVKEYLWCLDTGFDKHPEMAALRSEAVMGLLSLIQSNPKIIDEIEKRRGQARDKVSEGKATPNDVGNLAILNEAAGQPEETLKLYDKLRADEKTPPALRKALAQGAMAPLLDAKRYADIAADIDIAAAVDEQFAAAAKAPPGDERGRYMLIGMVSTYYQVLIGLKRDEEAAKVAKRLVQTVDLPETYNALAWNGFATGKPTQANLDQARKANELTGGKNAAAIDTLARILHALGKKEEAVKTVEDALKSVAEPSDREALQACLTDVKK